MANYADKFKEHPIRTSVGIVTLVGLVYFGKDRIPTSGDLSNEGGRIGVPTKVLDAEGSSNGIRPVSPNNSRYTRGLTGGRGGMPEVKIPPVAIEDRGTRFTLLNVFENEQEGTKTYILQGRCKNLVGGEFRGEKVISVQVFIYNGYDATEVVVGKKN
jgi:hypothetical protein